MSPKAQTFGSLIDDFKQFIKTAEEQGNSEKKVPDAKSDKEVKEMLPAGGNPTGTSGSNVTDGKGVPALESVPGQKEPATEAKKTVETSPTTSVEKAATLANSLMAKLVDLDKKAEMPPALAAALEKKEDKGEDKGEEKKEEKAEKKKEDKGEEKKEEKAEEKKEEKEASLDIEALAQKIAAAQRDMDTGYRLGKLLFGKQAESADVQMEKLGAALETQGFSPEEASLIMSKAGEFVPQLVNQLAAELALDKQAEAIAADLRKGGATEEQIEAYFVKAGQADRAEYERSQAEALLGQHATQMKQAGYSDAQIDEALGNMVVEAQLAQLDSIAIQKTAELLAEGKTEAEIAEYFKQAALADHQAAVAMQKEAEYLQAVEERVEKFAADLRKEGRSEQEIEAAVTALGAEDARLAQKVAELAKEGKTEAEIEAILMKEAEGHTNTDAAPGKTIAPALTAGQVTKVEGEAKKEVDKPAPKKEDAKAAPGSAAPAATAKAAELSEADKTALAVGRMKLAGYSDEQIQSHMRAVSAVTGVLKTAGLSEETITGVFTRLQQKSAKAQAVRKINEISDKNRGNAVKMAAELKKLAQEDPAAEAALHEAMGGAPEGMPVEGAPVEGAPGAEVPGGEGGLEKLLADLEQLVAEGVITEEEAMQILSELGLEPSPEAAAGGAPAEAAAGAMPAEAAAGAPAGAVA